MNSSANNFPKLHNAMWPGLVGKEPNTDHPPISLEHMLDMTVAADVDGHKFDGVDLFLFAPHVDIDSTDDDLKRLAEKVKKKGLAIGSVVAPVWPPVGGGSAMGSAVEAYTSLPPIISVAPGAAITVMIDRDLEFW